jgi:hypothetical protein
MKLRRLAFADLQREAEDKGLTLERGQSRYILRWPDGREIIALYNLEILAPIIALVPVPTEDTIWRDE